MARGKEERRKIKRAAIGASAAIGLGALLLVRFVLVTEPDSAAGLAYFKATYGLSPSKLSKLRRLSRELERHDGRYVPEGHLVFLYERLSSADPRETEAINWFLTTRSPGRQKPSIHDLPVKEKSDLIDCAIAHWNEGEEDETQRALAFIESIRRGSPLGKVTLVWVSGDPIEYADANLSVAQQLYSAWWNAPGIWEDRMAIDPLEGTGMEFIGP